MNKERDVRMDFARMILAFLVIAIHSDLSWLDAVPTARAFVVSTLFTTDGAFFTLSGYFLLNRELSTPQDYGNYYLKRFISVIFPWLIMHLILDVIFNRFIYAIGFEAYIKAFVKNLLVNDYYSYLWFMYAFIPIILCAPFFAKMLTHMAKFELVILACLTIAFLLFVEAISHAGLAFVFSDFMIGGFTIYFLLGHYLRRFSEEIRRFRFLFYIAGIIGLILVARATIVLDTVPGTLLGKPYYMVFVFALIIFLTSIPVEKCKVIAVVSKFVARHAFSIYLTHTYMIDRVDKLLEPIYVRLDLNFPLVVKNGVYYVFHILAAVAFAFLYDELIIFRLQDLLRFLFSRRKARIQKAD